MKDPDHGADPAQPGASGGTGAAPPGTRHGGKDARAESRGQGSRKPDGDARDQTGSKIRKRRRRRGRRTFVRAGPALDAGGDAAPDVAAAPAAADAAIVAGAVPPARPAESRLHETPVSGRPDRAPAPLRARRDGDLPVYAALDLGTNNCRLLMAVPTRPGRFRVVDAFSRIVRLGEGLLASGRLSEDAMQRAIEALKVCAHKLGARNVRGARLIATEACRSAVNGRAFLDRVKRETGLALEIIDRRTEARLAVAGCGSLIERGTPGVVLFDIGGGSSEIALVDLSRQHSPRLANHIVSWTSLPVGVVSLSERFGGRDVTRELFGAMVDDVAGLLEAFEGRARLSHVALGAGFHLLGTSGTVTTLAGIHLGLERYDRRRVDGLWMDSDMVDRMIDRVLGWDFDDRVANPCIGADRADLVLAGCAILEAIRRCWPSERLRVADRGLREGILSELMADDRAWRRSAAAQGNGVRP